MPLALRLFLAYFLFAGLSAYFIFAVTISEIKPGVRQSTEETLVDAANLLAEIIGPSLASGTLAQTGLEDALARYAQRQPQANIWGQVKNQVAHRVYVTDAKGIVLLDSAGIAQGQDFSRWRDVYLTLQGRYGARSTPADPNDPNSSVMHVAAPIMQEGRIIGSVTLAKPNRSFAPYIERSQQRLYRYGGGLLLLGLLVGWGLSWWLGRDLRKLTDYATRVSQGQRAELPQYRIRELKTLAGAMAQMRQQLDGKAYVETHVQNLTHELKSPLAGINAAAEILQDLHDKLSPEQRQQFSENIRQDAARMNRMITTLLDIARLEQLQSIYTQDCIFPRQYITDYQQQQAARLMQKNLTLINALPEAWTLQGNAELIQQALIQILENALEFTPNGCSIRIAPWIAAPDADQPMAGLEVFNTGETIADYALPRLGERFFSLPRPETGRKSSGLGLHVVQQIMQLHAGRLRVENRPGGVAVSLYWPQATR